MTTKEFEDEVDQLRADIKRDPSIVSKPWFAKWLVKNKLQIVELAKQRHPEAFKQGYVKLDKPAENPDAHSP